MEKVYPAKKGRLIHATLTGLILLSTVVFLLDVQRFAEKPFMLLLLISPVVLLLWPYFDTAYSIENEKLKYRSAFLKGEIEISDIRKVVKGQTLFAGIKPALATKGIIIRYKNYGEIYLAPEDNDELIADLLALNNQIEVEG